jgi:hypothetical protein
MNNPKPMITHHQMDILSAYRRALAGRDPMAVAASDLLPTMQEAVPGMTIDDLEDALRAENDRLHRMVDRLLLNAPVTGRPN